MDHQEDGKATEFDPTTQTKYTFTFQHRAEQNPGALQVCQWWIPQATKMWAVQRS